MQVEDVNDNAPLTRDPIYLASVPENAKPSTRVATIQASDADSGRLTFSIAAGNPQSLFHIDPATGILTTTRRHLDRWAAFSGNIQGGNFGLLLGWVDFDLDVPP